MLQKIFLCAALAPLLVGCGGSRTGSKIIEPVDFSRVRIEDSFWSPRIAGHAESTIAICVDQIENKTNRMSNFVAAASGGNGFSGVCWDDSDVYKALEGIAYSLAMNPDPGLERIADEWIDKIAAAQQPDGYINTYFISTGSKRWYNMDECEDYCAGHLIEAGVAYYRATGKRKLMDVGVGMADHMMAVVGEGKRHWVPGHEEIELALVKLAGATGRDEYIDFAHWLLEERGRGRGFFGEDGAYPLEQYQDVIPVRELSKISGHAVRALYLYCGMADVAAVRDTTGYIEALERLWEDVVFRKMYITGGVGVAYRSEGVSEDYDLPNLDAYCETCASVAMVYWNWRMNHFTGDGKYIDVMERAMYNGALAGVSLSGERFFYVNPLESLGGHHRQEWYGCACCPSQVARFIPSVGNYIYGTSDDALWVNLYMGSTAALSAGGKKMTVSQATGYPWDGKVTLTLEQADSFRGDIRLRIPSWCADYAVAVNGEPVEPAVDKGYAVLNRRWKDGDVVSLAMDMDVKVEASDPRVLGNVGKRAVQRGPVVYCMERVDNPDNYDDVCLTSSTRYTERFDPTLLGGVVSIDALDAGDEWTLVPYYAWDNRDAGPMRGWIDYKE